MVGEVFVEGLPVPDVGPAEGGGVNPGLVGFLHHGVVDGDAGHLSVDALQEDAPLGGVGEFLPAVPEPGNLGGTEVDLLADGVGAPEEDTGVPQELAGLEEDPGQFAVGFLGEGLDLDGTALFGCARHLDVTEIGIGTRGDDPEGDEGVGAGGVGEGRQQGLVEDVVAGDGVVGGSDHSHGIGVALQHFVGGEGDAGGGVAVVGLQQEVLLRKLGELGPDQVAVAVQAYHQDVLLGDDGFHPVVGAPQEGAALDAEVEELLGQSGAADGPESGSDPAGENYAIIVVIRHSAV